MRIAMYEDSLLSVATCVDEPALPASLALSTYEPALPASLDLSTYELALLASPVLSTYELALMSFAICADVPALPALPMLPALLVRPTYEDSLLRTANYDDALALQTTCEWEHFVPGMAMSALLIETIQRQAK